MFPLKQFLPLSIITTLGFITVTASQATTHHNFIPVGFNKKTQPTHNQTLIAQKQSKVALVIGNAAYEEKPLSNPVNDATDMTKALQELGFEVTLLQNRDLRTMKDGLNKFRQQLQRGGVGLFYYAGHGIQVDGKNYLIPLKAELNIETDVEYEALDLRRVLNAMEASQTRINIVIIDACREYFVYRGWPSPYRSLSNRGLADVQWLPEGTVIAFATAPGKVASDGDGRNSPFTSALLQHIKKANYSILSMLQLVNESVSEDTEDTNEKQEPWITTNLKGGEFFLNKIATHSPTSFHQVGVKEQPSS